MTLHYRIPIAVLLLSLGTISAGCGGSPVAELAAELQDEDHEVRYEAIKKLEKFGPESVEAVEALANTLSDPSEKVRYRSAKALSKIGIGAESVAEELAEALEKANPAMRYYLVKALANVEDAAVVALDELTTLLAEDEEARIRQYAAKALGKIGKEAQPALPVLEEATDDPDEKVRKAVNDALKKIKK